MDRYIEYFTNYVFKNYDMTNASINLKYYHSLRVAKLTEIIAKKMNMPDEDVLLAYKLGLCHDLGRFYEIVLNGKFDNLKFDHGTYSNKILYNDLFINYMDIDEHLLFRKAIYNHNKKDITSDLNSRENTFVNMLRDADKIDIIGLRSKGKTMNFSDNPTEIVLDNYHNNQTIDISNLNNKSDSVILYLSFIKDLYYEISYDIALNYGYLDALLNVINIASDKKDLFDKLINEMDEKRGKVYVR